MKPIARIHLLGGNVPCLEVYELGEDGHTQRVFAQRSFVTVAKAQELRDQINATTDWPIGTDSLPARRTRVWEIINAFCRIAATTPAVPGNVVPIGLPRHADEDHYRDARREAYHTSDFIGRGSDDREY